MPFFWFSNFGMVRSHPTFLINEIQYLAIMQTVFDEHPSYKKHWEDKYASQY